MTNAARSPLALLALLAALPYAAGCSGAPGADDAAGSTESATSNPWRGWMEVPGSGTTNEGLSAIDAVWHDRIYLFAKGIIYQGSYVNVMDGASGQWTGWGEIPGGGLSDQPLGSAACLDGVYVFRKGTDQRIYVNALPETQYSIGSWTGWSEVPGGGLTNLAPAAYCEGMRTLHLYVTGLDGHIWENVHQRALPNGAWTGWTGWHLVPGGFQTNAAVTVGNDVDENGFSMYLFAKGYDQHEYLNPLRVSDGTWMGWREVGAGGTTDVAMTAADNQLFAKGINDRQIYWKDHEWNGSQYLWIGWSLVSGIRTNAPVGSVFHISGTNRNPANTGLYLFATEQTSHHIYFNVARF